MSRYLLVPVDGLEKESKVVTIPNGLVVDPFEELYQHVRDKELLKNLSLNWQSKSIKNLKQNQSQNLMQLRKSMSRNVPNVMGL